MTVIQFNSQYQGNECHKLNYDQYYTPDDVALRCTIRTKEILGSKVAEYYETSAGAGAFVRAIEMTSPTVPLVAVDIQPKWKGVVKADFLKTEIGYRKGRCFIGNPPFGARLNLARSFWKKCIQKGDYVAWILPISQYRSNPSFYEFDLVYSENLGNVQFSGCKPVRCCFNIYARPKGLNNKRKIRELRTVTFMRSDSKKYPAFDYDFRMRYWGGKAGTLLEAWEPDISMVYKIKVKDPSKREYVRKVLTSTDWTKERPSVSVKKITKEVIVRVLKRAGIE